MKSPDGKTISAWKKIGPAPQYPQPPASGKADVCVVGAGIAGLSCAYRLARDGKSVGPNEGGYLVVKKRWPSMLRTIY